MSDKGRGCGAPPLVTLLPHVPEEVGGCAHPPGQTRRYTWGVLPRQPRPA